MNITKDFEETGMSFLEYKDKEASILNAHANGSITRKVMYMLLEDNRKAYNEWQEYRRNPIGVTSMKEHLDRMEEAQKRMRARRDEIANQWAKAYPEDGKIKVRKGCTGLPLVDMTVLEARLLAAQILSLTNTKKKKIMIKCIECGKLIVDGGTRYATPDGSFCCDCWENKDQKFKDAMLKRAMYGLDSFAKAIADVKKGGDR